MLSSLSRCHRHSVYKFTSVLYRQQQQPIQRQIYSLSSKHLHHRPIMSSAARSHSPPVEQPDAKRLKTEHIPASEGPSSTIIPEPEQENPTTAAESSSKGGKPRGKRGGQKNKQQKRRDRRPAPPDAYSPGDVLWRDVLHVLGSTTSSNSASWQEVQNAGHEYAEKAKEEGWDYQSPFACGREDVKAEIEVDICMIGSDGDALAVHTMPEGKKWVIIVPFTLPGERALVRVHTNARLHSTADFVRLVSSPSAPHITASGVSIQRNDALVGCKYFGECAGCQYQMIPYTTQKEIKRDVVLKAYRNFSGLPVDDTGRIDNGSSGSIEVGETIGSPLEYGYRTKITPHFQLPRKGKEDEELTVGFNMKGRKNWVLDIEDCPIATNVIRERMPSIRAEVKEKGRNKQYKRGATLLLRDSFPSASESDGKHVCVTEPNSNVRERIGGEDGMLFEFRASTFFQNNNSVLPSLVEYVRASLFDFTPSVNPPPTRLLDTYCGAGLFSICLSPHFTHSSGIELSKESIDAAKHNAYNLNGLDKDRVSFVSGDAGRIFRDVQWGVKGQEGWEQERARTAIVIDPPRKGCSDEFLEQLMKWGAGTVVYVSCNVHTQARDVGVLVQGGSSVAMEVEGEKRWRYKLESVRGFDLFPQTAHVESVALLRRVEE